MGVDGIVLFDYFMTSSDEAAVAEAQIAVGHAYPYVEGSGTDPLAQMIALEAILSDRPFAELAEEALPRMLYADPATGDPVVVRVRAELVKALATASEANLVDAASVGSVQLGELVGGVGLRQFLGDLADLARLVDQGWGQLYCFVYR